MRGKAYGDLEMHEDTFLPLEGSKLDSREPESNKVVPDIEVAKVRDTDILVCDKEVGSTEESELVKKMTDTVGSDTPELRRSTRVRQRAEKFADFVN